jgi:hypothetical protein
MFIRISIVAATTRPFGSVTTATSSGEQSGWFPAQESVDIINYVMVESRLVFLAKNGTVELIE